jgi:hypothetical protein
VRALVLSGEPNRSGQLEGSAHEKGKLGGVNQPLSLTLSFGEIPWFHVRGEVQRCDWSKNVFFTCAQYAFLGYGLFQANHSAVFPTVHQTTEFRQTTV